MLYSVRLSGDAAGRKPPIAQGVRNLPWHLEHQQESPESRPPLIAGDWLSCLAHPAPSCRWPPLSRADPDPGPSSFRIHYLGISASCSRPELPLGSHQSLSEEAHWLGLLFPWVTCPLALTNHVSRRASLMGLLAMLMPSLPADRAPVGCQALGERAVNLTSRTPCTPPLTQCSCQGEPQPWCRGARGEGGCPHQSPALGVGDRGNHVSAGKKLGVLSPQREEERGEVAE